MSAVSDDRGDKHVLARVVAAEKIREAVEAFDGAQLSLSSVNTLCGNVLGIAEFLSRSLPSDASMGRDAAIEFEQGLSRGEAMLAANVGLRIVNGGRS